MVTSVPTGYVPPMGKTGVITLVLVAACSRGKDEGQGRKLSDEEVEAIRSKNRLEQKRRAENRPPRPDARPAASPEAAERMRAFASELEETYGEGADVAFWYEPPSTLRITDDDCGYRYIENLSRSNPVDESAKAAGFTDWKCVGASNVFRGEFY